MLFGRQPQTCGKTPAIFILSRICRMHHNGCSGNRANSRYLLEPFAGFVILGKADNARFVLFHQLITGYKLSIQFRQIIPGCHAQPIFKVFNSYGQKLADTGYPFGNNNTLFQQERLRLIRQCCALLDFSFAYPVPRGQILLLNGFDSYKTCGRSARNFTDCSGICRIRFVVQHKRLYMAWGNELNSMARIQFGYLSGPIMGSPARFQSNKAWRKIGKE